MKSDLLHEAVAQYREKTYHDWKKGMVLSLLFLGSLVTLIHSSQLFTLFFVQKELSALEQQISYLQTTKIERIKETKQLKDAQAVAKLLSKPLDIAHTLKAVSRAIPDHTILTTLSYDRETLFSLAGYTSNTEELQLFLANLKVQACSEVTPERSEEDAAGRKFTITLLA